MSRTETDPGTAFPAAATSSRGWQELWLKEDWWAIWLGLGIVVAAYLLFANGSVASGGSPWLARRKWSDWSQLGAHFAGTWERYVAQLVLWLAAFSLALGALGHKPGEFVPAFLFLYVAARSSSSRSASGIRPTPTILSRRSRSSWSVLRCRTSSDCRRWLDAGFRGRVHHIKLGIVLAGRDLLPFTLIAWAGPVAIAQASIVSGSSRSW